MSDKIPRKHRTASSMYEVKYYDQGYRYIFGMDEAGRGPMAGPLVAGAVCLPVGEPDLEERLKGVKDSKQMTARQRKAASDKIKEVALAWGIGKVTAHEIGEIGNMTTVTLVAMRRALEAAEERGKIEATFLLIDYYQFPFYDAVPRESLTKGDTLSLSIAAASVLAKVYRDELMIDYAHTYPVYGFEKHKGYPTKEHMAALNQYGPCEIHRPNYAPVRQARLKGF